MARKTGNWTFTHHAANGSHLTAAVNIEFDANWAIVWYTVEGQPTVRKTAKVEVVRQGRFGVRRDSWGYPVIGAAPIEVVYGNSEDGTLQREGKTIKGAVETWASEVVVRATREAVNAL